METYSCIFNEKFPETILWKTEKMWPSCAAAAAVDEFLCATKNFRFNLSRRQEGAHRNFANKKLM